MTSSSVGTSSPPAVAAANISQHMNVSNSADSPMDFNSELARRLMMKKQNPQQQASNSNGENNQSYRPFPQPPGQFAIDRNINQTAKSSYVHMAPPKSPKNRYVLVITDADEMIFKKINHC